MSLFPRHAERLAVTAARGRARALLPALGRDFASNDYLGLSASAVLADGVQAAIARGVPVGSGGSRLLRGNDPEFAALEAEAADFFGTESSLFMGGGFQANQAIFSALPMADDLVLYDARIHASVHEGMRLGPAQSLEFRHNDAQHAEDQIRDWRVNGGRGRIWIALETLCSMDGDFAPLADFIALARAYDAVLVLDEAHATGLYGPMGRGLADVPGDIASIVVHTCGKALGAGGALICAGRIVTETLINRARPFIYATAPSPLVAAAVRAALLLLQTRPALIGHAKDLRLHAHRAASGAGLKLGRSQILPLIIGQDHAALRAAHDLREAGFDLRAIRPPTVAKGSARLRISITGGLQVTDIDALFAAIAGMKTEYPT
ncbi:8-amino-7-oxononanoate synthase [Pseudomonas sp. GX19020]|uniref:8-amino-7-oxononanoate synthase n=1 Tax=Pseudomonas sp. GX19020 TaxID=2942277 RepID=UPI002018700F|nr:8-amino-7-oxononanoate synthase [Pseudomonas sp. GX19020]